MHRRRAAALTSLALLTGPLAVGCSSSRTATGQGARPAVSPRSPAPAAAPASISAAGAPTAGGTPSSSRSTAAPTPTPSSAPASLTVVRDVTEPADLQPAYEVGSTVTDAIYYLTGSGGGLKPPLTLKRFDTKTGAVSTVVVGLRSGGDYLADSSTLYSLVTAGSREVLERLSLPSGRLTRSIPVGAAAMSEDSLVVVGDTALVHLDQRLVRVNLTSGAVTPSQGTGSPTDIVLGRRVLLGTSTAFGFPGASDLDTGALTVPGPAPSGLPADLDTAGPLGVYLIGDNEHGGPPADNRHVEQVTRLDPGTLAQTAQVTESLGTSPNHFISLAIAGDTLYSTAGECGLDDTTHVCVYRRDPATLVLSQAPVLKVTGSEGTISVTGGHLELELSRDTREHLLTLSTA